MVKLYSKILPETLLSIKREVVDKLVKKYNAKHSYEDKKGNLRNSIGMHEKDGKIYIVRGMDLITVI